nr:MAG TPA: hypothetical protein [Caudoviricetes sp.]
MRVLHFILLAVVFLATILSGGSILFGMEERNGLIVLFGAVATFGCLGWFILLLMLIFG